MTGQKSALAKLEPILDQAKFGICIIDVHAGIAVAAFDGYQNVNDGGWFVAPLPLLAVEGRRFGANFTIVPTISDKVHGAVVLQLKLRVW